MHFPPELGGFETAARHTQGCHFRTECWDHFWRCPLTPHLRGQGWEGDAEAGACTGGGELPLCVHQCGVTKM